MLYGDAVGRSLTKFKCKRCGRCCSKIGELALFEWEAERLRRYSVRIKPVLTSELNGSRIILQWGLEGKNKRQCPFLTKRGCIIYEKRPLVCKAFPFMTSGIALKNLEKILSKTCENLIIPFKNGEKMKKQEALKILEETYNGSYSSAMALDTAREWIKEMFEYAAESGVAPDEKEIGLFEMLRKYNIMNPKEIEDEIRRLESM
ncbi:MAG: YkgJ family cysteine cluster protein [Candidatus Micrarchaeia archaeon]